MLLDNSTLEIQPIVTEALTSTESDALHIVRRVPVPHAGAGNVYEVISTHNVSKYRQFTL